MCHVTSTLTNQRRVFKACLTQKRSDFSDDFIRKIGPSRLYFLNYAYFDIQPSPDNYETPYIIYFWAKCLRFYDHNQLETVDCTCSVSLNFLGNNSTKNSTYQGLQINQSLYPILMELASVNFALNHENQKMGHCNVHAHARQVWQGCGLIAQICSLRPKGSRI